MIDEERYLIDILETLKAEYMKAAQPYLLRLARIRETKQNILLSAEQAREFGFLPPNTENKQ